MDGGDEDRMVRRLAQCVRGAVRAPGLLRGAAEAWVGGLGRVRAARGLAPAANPHGEVERLLAWLTSSTLRARGYPGDAVVDDEIVALYEAANGAGRQRVQAQLAEHLARTDAPTFRHALRLAGRIPLPAARDFLLGHLTETQTPLSSNGRGEMRESDPRAMTVRALGRLNDPSLRPVFVTLIERHAPLALWDAAARRVLHEAGWALCRLEAYAFADELPWLLQADPLFLADVLAVSGVRPVVARWLGTLAPARAANLRHSVPELGG